MTLARTVFFGTPSFAVPIFEALREVSNVVAVVCQPDKPVGRGLSVQAPPVKVAAMAAGIPVVQPTKLRNGEFAAWLREQSADVAVVAAYGRILPDDVLAAPRLGCVNAHASLLPRYRGAAPIQWAIVRGETQSGVCLMQMDAGLDTGDVLSVHSTQIGAEETAGELMTRLSLLAADALRADWSAFLAGNLKRMPQDHSLATLAPLLKKEDGLIDWRKTNREIHDLVRGVSPWPGAATVLRGKPLKVHKVSRVEIAASHAPGEVFFADRSRVLVATGEGAIELIDVQPEGKRIQRATDLVNGRALAVGDRLGT